DVAVLTDAWGVPTRNYPQLVVHTNAWDHLWWPEWNTHDGWRMVRVPRTDLLLTPLRHAHGLDELTYHAGHLVIGGSEPTGVLGSEYVADGFALHGMGLLAIAASAARRAVSRARDYSLTRRQGGQVIGAHDAVAQLLARSEQSLATTRAVLDHLAGLPADLSRLQQVWRARAQLHPLLTAAGSDALQVFGGVGYMRDVGAEKDLRDLNTVRRLGGSPMELTLRCAGFDDSLGVVP
ncbi:MAG TPA: acyl-CoA dehydrogenase family protein, partial [Mycobacterium sp.]|nr:acyl-CoA dehydrogenase family protein [Mycobacterium sp.]